MVCSMAAQSLASLYEETSLSVKLLEEKGHILIKEKTQELIFGFKT